MKVSLCIKIDIVNMLILLLLSQYMIILIVNGKDLACEAGYGAPSGKIFISGSASQCSGLSKITTEAECELAAEYNSKNNIDKNVGYWGRTSWSKYPPGCIYYLSGNYYYWNDDDTKSTAICSYIRKCICKPKTCVKCPINTYSKGGTNPTCTPCPFHAPTTNFKTGQSFNGCIRVPRKKCDAGRRVIGDGITRKIICTECPINTYGKGGINPSCTPCPKKRPTTNFKRGQTSSNACIPVPKINCVAGKGVIAGSGDGIWRKKICTECPINTISEGGDNAECKSCKNGKVTIGTGKSKCVGQFNSKYVLWKLDNIDKVISAQKEKQNDLSIKNSRLWQKEQIVMNY